MIATSDTVLMGHGFEGITGSATRNQIMERVVGSPLRWRRIRGGEAQAPCAPPS